MKIQDAILFQLGGVVTVAFELREGAPVGVQAVAWDVRSGVAEPAFVATFVAGYPGWATAFVLDPTKETT